MSQNNEKRFRALLLAAGLGTRLRPLTYDIPKCLVQIGSEPLLSRWLRQLDEAGCEAVLVNTHYMYDKVEKFLQRWPTTTMIIEYVRESELQGTAGTLLANQDFFQGCTGLLIHADNIMSGNIKEFIEAHHMRPSACELTMLTFDTDNPQACGIVQTDHIGIVLGFHEKVNNPPGTRANGAIYAFSQYFLRDLTEMYPQPTDFSTQVIPAYVGRINTWHTHAPYMDIGTPAALQIAQTIADFQ